jgi:dynein heavy chain
LNFVANRFLGDIEFKTGELEGCVELCEYFHNSTITLSNEVRRKYQLFNYVTPASYLELNILFKKLLKEHREKVHRTKSMYEVSLEKLKGAESQVTVMQEEMAALQPKLSIASKQVDTNMTLVEKEQTEVAELEKIVKGEDTLVNEKKKIAESIRNDCDGELTEVNTVIDGALDAIAALSQSEIAAVRAVKAPSVCLKLNMEAICLLKNIKPDRVPDTSGGGNKMVDDYWGPTKRILGDPKFVENMSTFDKDNIPAKTAKLIRDKYLSNSDINPDKTKSNLVAMDSCSRALNKWVIAIDMYEKVAKNVAPKREALVKAEGDYQESLEQLNKKKANLREAQEKLKAVHDDLQQKKQKKAELENEVDLCTRKLERAEQLITGFGGEREKWSETSKKLEKKLNQLTGDILLAVGTVAYLGTFPDIERQNQIEKWQKKALELKVPYSEDYSLQGTLGNQNTIQSWYMNGLLRDNLSTDNGIILSTAERWVLMVDPQDIANRWIKTMEKQKNLSVLKQSDKDFLRSLENCIQFGTPVLLENVGESLDPALEPLLQKQTFQQGGSVCIKLGESTIEYSKDFRMYITTRLKNPHFPPETTAKIAMVNFSISKDGLVDQLLGIIVARERPELEEERSQVIGQINENKKNLGDIENKILSVLYSSKGNILEDENAIKTLSSSKVLANEIVEKQLACENAKNRIDDNRNEYLDLTRFAVTLFFTGNHLSMINHMYQFSLAWFINLFCTSIDVADKSEELDERLDSIKDHFIRSLFVNTSASLFEEDKIIYSFLLACSLGKDCEGIMDTDLWQYMLKLIKEPESSEVAAGPDWIDGKIRAKIGQLIKLSNFEEIITNEENSEKLRSFWLSEVPHRDPSFDSLCENLTPFKKMLFLLTLRPDKLPAAIRRFVIDTLGDNFVQQEPLDVGKSFQETSAATPLIIILKEEVNPCNYIFRFADEMGFQGRKLRILSLGSGQEERARETIKECSQVSIYYMPTLSISNIMHYSFRWLLGLFFSTVILFLTGWTNWNTCVKI